MMVVIVAGVSAARMLARAAFESLGHESPQQERAQHDHHDPPEELGERELPADQHEERWPELPHQVRRCDLEGDRGWWPKRPSPNNERAIAGRCVGA